MAKLTVPQINVDENIFKDLIYVFRGKQVMVDSDLAAIYGYSTGQFNLQVKHNIDKFDDDFMFQLTIEELEILKLKNSISSNDIELPDEFKSDKKPQNWGGRRTAPYVFTEQGIYMLMTVLKGELATRQSKALIRTFKQMKDYVINNQPLLNQRDILQLSLQTAKNATELIDVRKSLSVLDDKVAGIVDSLSEVITKSQLADIIKQFGQVDIRKEWLLLNGQPVEADLAYKQIYAMAKHSIIIIDNYIGLKTLALMSDVSSEISIIVISDNINGMLRMYEYEDLINEYRNLNIVFKRSDGKFHDRYIVIDHNTEDELIFHCGASSKDGGKKIASILLSQDNTLYHPLIENILNNRELVLR